MKITTCAQLHNCIKLFSPQAFGIISTVLFTVDTVLYCIKNRNTGSAQPPTSSFEGSHTEDTHEPIEWPEANLADTDYYLRWLNKSTVFISIHVYSFIIFTWLLNSPYFFKGHKCYCYTAFAYYNFK